MTPANLEELYDLLRIPSVSADPSHTDDVRRAGEWVRDLVRSAKGSSAELIDTDAQPLLIGNEVIVATENMNHLARLVTARSWTDTLWPQ